MAQKEDCSYSHGLYPPFIQFLLQSRRSRARTRLDRQPGPTYYWRVFFKYATLSAGCGSDAVWASDGWSTSEALEPILRLLQEDPKLPFYQLDSPRVRSGGIRWSGHKVADNIKFAEDKDGTRRLVQWFQNMTETRRVETQYKELVRITRENSFFWRKKNIVQELSLTSIYMYPHNCTSKRIDQKTYPSYLLRISALQKRWKPKPGDESWPLPTPPDRWPPIECRDSLAVASMFPFVNIVCGENFGRRKKCPS